MLLENCKILEHRCLAKNIYQLVLESRLIAPEVQAGQFVHLQIPDQRQHILRRPFSVYDVLAEQNSLSIVYQIVGQGTEAILSLKAGQELSLLGPIGKGWVRPDTTNRSLLIGGGIGAAPLLLLAKDLLGNSAIDLILGAANADMLVFNSDYSTILGSENIHICTDDGSAGSQGFTTTLAADLMEQKSYDWIASCGPEPMQAGIAKLAKQFNIACQVSLEQRMACGLGACLSCVVDTKNGRQRACVDGPVFEADEVIW